MENRAIAANEQSAALILEQIKQMLISSDLRPGDQVPAEKDLAERLRASRSGVREALAALTLTGVLEARKEGLFVRRAPANDVVEPLRLVFSMAREQVQAVVEARMALEVQTAELAARRRDKSNLAALERIVGAMRDDLDLRQRDEQLDLDFHLEVAKATQNPLLNRMMKAVLEAIHSTLHTTRAMWLSGCSGTPRQLYEEHEAIFIAIRAGEEASARDLMHRHLALVETQIVKQ
ncbi:MAG: FadR family transcriptional regulator [Gracilibacteraceae bacterium]|jgi:DNA-binding FadR family transcriptional regulator|nr:FadR family transcriptional regulator [Gracilibacteraceae bacterium]